MLALFAITAPIFIIIAIGFVTVRLEFFSKVDVRILGVFVINFALPALIVRALSQGSLAEIINVNYLLAYAGGSLTALVGGVVFNRFIRKKSLKISALCGLGMAASNSGFVGYPVVLQLLGPTAAVGLALNMLVENIVIIPLALVLLESSGNKGESVWTILQNIVIRLFRNPLILAMIVGVTLAVFELRLPEPLMRVVDMFAMAAGSAALFVIGGSLVGLKVRGMVQDATLILVGKLLLHPLAVLVALLLLPPFDPALQMAAFAFACMPMMGIYPILGQRYGQESLCAATLMATTVASFVSISVLLWWVVAAGWLTAV